MIGAFFLGVEIARGTGRPRPEGTAKPQAKGDYTVGVPRAGAGVTLRLDSFSQRGKDVVVRVTVPPQPSVDIGAIRNIVVVPLTANGEAIAKVPLDVRATTFGFVAAGHAVDDPATPVTGIEIMTLTQALTPTGDLLPVDLTKVWPVRPGGAPKAASARASARYSDGRTFTVTGLVGWPDRVEAGLVVQGDRTGWSYEEDFSLVFQSEAPVGGTLIQETRPAPGTRHVVFQGLSASARSTAIQIIVHSATIEGHWRWMFAY